MRRWIEIKEMEVNRSWTENLGIMWRSVFCCMDVERLTPRTEVEIEINSDLDSTLIPSSACLLFFFFPPSMRPVETQSKLSPQTVKDNISLSSQCRNRLPRKGYSLTALICHFFLFGSRQCWVQWEGDSWRDYSELILSYLSTIAADYAFIHTELSCVKCPNHHHIT